MSSTIGVRILADCADLSRSRHSIFSEGFANYNMPYTTKDNHRIRRFFVFLLEGVIIEDGVHLEGGGG